MKNSFTVRLKGKRYCIPYRSYQTLNHIPAMSQEKLCVYTRNHDGFIRERSLVQLLKYPEIKYTSIPYILKLAEEYVLEITEIVLANLPRIPDTMWGEFLRENPRWLDLMECHCISYWDCYYRHRLYSAFTNRNDYPGLQVVKFLRNIQ